SGDDVDMQPTGPTDIVAFGTEPDVGLALLHIDIENNSVASYNLLNDLNIGSVFTVQVLESSKQVEIMSFDNFGGVPEVKLTSFVPASQNFSSQALNVDLTDYLWSSGASSEKYIVVKGVSRTDPANAMFTLFARGSNNGELFTACESCRFNRDIPPLIIGDILYDLYLSREDNFWYIQAINLEDQTVKFLSRLNDSPRVVIGEPNLFIDEINQELQIHNNMNFESMGFQNFSLLLGQGLRQAVDNKTLAFRVLPQPAPIASEVNIYDLNTGNVIEDFTWNELNANTSVFSEKVGFTLGFMPLLSYVDLKRDFALFDIFEVANSGNPNRFALVYSNYANQYNGHIETPFRAHSVVAVF
ncbi:MAG: hypothetical protein AAFO69_17420, partial [Bacteroidota bacterium]